MKKVAFLNKGLFIILFLSVTSVQCQSYIATDSLYTSGIVIPINNTSIQFQKFAKDKPTVYTSDYIKEYGYKDKIFESLIQNGKSQFYLRFAKSDKIKIFKRGSNYLVIKNESIELVDRRNLVKIIRELYNCEKSIPKKSFSNSKSINFNLPLIANNCDYSNLLFRRVGIIGGYSNDTFVAEQPVIGTLALNESWKGSANNSLFGLLLDIPIFKLKNLFLTTGVIYTFGRATLNGKPSSIDLSTNQIAAPIALKWIFRNQYIKPFIKAGGIISYVNIDVKTSSTFFGTVRLTNSNLAYGIQAAIGFEIPLKSLKAIQLELNYTEFVKRNFDKLDIKISGISITGAYTF